MKRGLAARICLLITTFILLAVLATVGIDRQDRQEEERENFLEEHLYFDTLSVRLIRREGNDIGSAEKIKGYKQWMDGHFYLFLPSYGDRVKLQLHWEYADSLLIDGVEYKNDMIWEPSDFEESHSFAFYRDGNLQEAWDVIVMCAGELPTIYIDTKSGSMEEIHADREHRERGRFYLFDIRGQLLCADNLDYVKGRGNTTWDQEKKPYSVKLASKQNLLGMGAAKKWELLANAYDGSQMRNQLIFDMAQEAGMEATPQAEWVNLYLNGEYQGIYQLAETVEIDGQRLNIGGKKQGQGELTGSYLMVMEDGSRTIEEGSCIFTESGHGFTLKNPKEATEEQLAYIEGLLREFEVALTSPGGYNPDTGKYYLDYIDPDSFVKKYLIEEIAKNSDAVINSQYFYKKPDQESKLLYAGPVWDYDNALGHTNEEAMNPEGFLLNRVYEDGFTNLWYGTLCSFADFWQRVGQVYRDVFSELLAETIRKTDIYREALRGAAEADRRRWLGTNMSFRYKVCDSWDAYVDYLQEFLVQRKVFLDEAFCQKTE